MNVESQSSDELHGASQVVNQSAHLSSENSNDAGKDIHNVLVDVHDVDIECTGITYTCSYVDISSDA